MGRRHPPPLPPIKQVLGRSEDPDMRIIGAKIEEYLKHFGRAQYLGEPASHTHSSSSSGGALPVTAFEQAELIGWLAWLRTDDGVL